MDATQQEARTGGADAVPTVFNEAEIAKHRAAMAAADVTAQIIRILLGRLEGKDVSNRDAVSLAREIRQQQEHLGASRFEALRAKDRACGHIEAV